MSLTRRELCAMFPAVLIPTVVSPVAAAEEAKVLPSAMFPFEKLTPHKSNAAEIRPVLKGKLATGESVEVHETTLSPGGMPHPPQDQAERRQAEIGFRLAAAGGEEQQVHNFSILVRRFDDSLQVHQQEGKLEGPPDGRIDRCRISKELFRNQLGLSNNHRVLRRTQHAEQQRGRHRSRSSDILDNQHDHRVEPDEHQSAVLVEESERAVQPSATPPLPPETVTLARPSQVVQNLLFDPVANIREAPARVAGRKVLHPAVAS